MFDLKGIKSSACLVSLDGRNISVWLHHIRVGQRFIGKGLLDSMYREIMEGYFDLINKYTDGKRKSYVSE